jgi:hypothetical protein
MAIPKVLGTVDAQLLAESLATFWCGDCIFEYVQNVEHGKQVYWIVTHVRGRRAAVHRVSEHNVNKLEYSATNPPTGRFIADRRMYIAQVMVGQPPLNEASWKGMREYVASL